MCVSKLHSEGRGGLCRIHGDRLHSEEGPWQQSEIVVDQAPRWRYSGLQLWIAIKEMEDAVVRIVNMNYNCIYVVALNRSTHSVIE